uniref:Uncharacterized protein n=1 Tax=Coturnix japonica TaxID=93934 RepID=A0A8C2TTJ7_COTJA
MSVQSGAKRCKVIPIFLSPFLPFRWVPVASSAVSLLLCALLLLVLYIMLSRKIGNAPLLHQPSWSLTSQTPGKALHQKTSKDDLNYTSVLFSGKGHRSGSYRNYENMKVGADYVNVDPKKKKADFWACSSPVASKPIEYTEVKL